MTKWEYKTIRIPFTRFHNADEKIHIIEDTMMKEMGEQGWELIHIETHLGAPVKLYFKRQKIEFSG